MNSLRLNIVLRFIVLVLVQVVLCNHIDFLGYINPYIYIVFILIYPANNNRVLFLLSAFLLGLCVDIFSDSGGVHAAASVCIAYIRPIILKFSFGMLYEHQTIKFSNLEFGSLLGYVAILTLTHHFILFSLEIFSITQILMILQKTLFSGLFTLVLTLIVILLFSPKSK